MIDRKALLKRHNPVLHGVEPESPLSVGNGEFAFTADVTGLQSLYGEYRCFPLCTMSQWGWHTAPAANARGFYTLADAEPTRYHIDGREYRYIVDCKPGNETVYHWLRQNPHRLNLARIALTWNGEAVCPQDLGGIEQTLDLYTGVLYSEFTLRGQPVSVRTVCAQSNDTVGFSIRSGALGGALAVEISFPYGSPLISASDWSGGDRHTTVLRGTTLERTLDGTQYVVALRGADGVEQTGAHTVTLRGNGGALELTATFAPKEPSVLMDFDNVLRDSETQWEDFWNRCGAVDFRRCTDPRAGELERRTVLSQYQTAVNCSGSLPPQETGLACNSWYGKFHLEMHPLHAAWFPLWGCGERLERSFAWYEGILERARENAVCNGFNGARWPKMVGPEGIDSPSHIATLLIWQQPHILYMLELVRHSKPVSERGLFMRRYWPLVRETAEFMRHFAEHTGDAGLLPPLIPAQEEHDPAITRNPAFELCYWRFGLKLACIWAREIGEDGSAWERVRKRLPAPPVHEGHYIAHQHCPDTFTRFHRDHPSMLFGLGFIPCGRVDRRILSDTCDKVLQCWDFQTAWGWDFALMAMTFARLGRPEAAVDALLMQTHKNTYAANGHNFQRGRDDLPLYLPGNGSLLLALSLLLAGYGEERGCPGFPRDGSWEMEYEGISPLPY